jgi:site-specific recombinase XerC
MSLTSIGTGRGLGALSRFLTPCILLSKPSVQRHGDDLSRQLGCLDWIRSLCIRHHSLRRTKATLVYHRTGKFRAVQLLFGHAKLESTVRYLGIEVEYALAIAEQVDV